MDHELEEEKVDQTLSWREKWQFKNTRNCRPVLVYEIIRRDGAEELDRPTAALIFSGIAAGLVISFSFVFKAIIASYIPTDAIWTDLITNFGYTIGFLIAILGHMQLFTENTITTVAPI